MTTGPLFPALSDPSRSDRPALRFSATGGPGGSDEAVTYGELTAVADRLAGRIRGRSRVAVWATPTLATAVGVVAGLRAGVPVVPVNAKLGERELDHVLSDSGPEALLVAPGVGLPDAAGRLERIDVDPSGTEPGPAPDGEPEPDAPALVVYTSGTTGAPKGAVLSRGALASNLDALADAWDWTGDDRLAHALPLFHVHGLVLGTLGPLRRGGALHHLGTLTGSALAAAVDDGATMVFGVPTQYHRLAADLEADAGAATTVGRARLLVSGSAALTAVDHARIATATGLSVRERYGLTETLILTAARADSEPEIGTVGRPLPGTEVRLAPLPADTETNADDAEDADDLGGVEVRGPSLFSGYLNLPDATAETTTDDGWYATGDIGRWTASGALALVGRRATDLIKSGGYRIGAGEIENALLEHPSVAEVAVIGEPDDDLGERIVAHVVIEPEAGERPAEHELVDHVTGLLSAHKRPREIRYRDTLPRNDMGKIQKKLLQVNGRRTPNGRA